MADRKLERDHLYRTVSVRVWRDKRFRALSDRAQIVFLRLLTGPETTRVPGLVEAGRLQLAEALWWEPEDFDAAWGEIEHAELAVCDWRSQLVYLPRALKHRPIYGTDQATGVVRALADVADSPLLSRVAEDLRAYAHGLPEGSGTRTALLKGVDNLGVAPVSDERIPTPDQVVAEVYPQRVVDNLWKTGDRSTEDQDQDQDQESVRAGARETGRDGASSAPHGDTRAFVAQVCCDVNAICAEGWTKAGGRGDPPRLRFGSPSATVAARAYRRDTATDSDHERSLRRREWHEVLRTAVHASVDASASARRPAAYALATIFGSIESWDECRRRHAELRGLGRVEDKAHAAKLDRGRNATTRVTGHDDRTGRHGDVPGPVAVEKVIRSDEENGRISGLLSGFLERLEAGDRATEEKEEDEPCTK